jgi:RHS repeat-associated protein
MGRAVKAIDHLSSSTQQLDTNGTLVSREEYYPFGETSFGSYEKKRYRFCGKERDDESGLYYYGARYYAAWTCRFTTVDPLAIKYAHQSSYCYADNNPIMKNDPTGMGSEPAAGGGGGNNGGGSESKGGNNINAPESSIKDIPKENDSPNRSQGPISEKEAGKLKDQGFKAIEGDITKPHYERKTVWVKDAKVQGTDSKGAYYHVWELKPGESPSQRQPQDVIEMPKLKIPELPTSGGVTPNLEKLPIPKNPNPIVVPNNPVLRSRNGGDFGPMTEGYKLKAIIPWYKKLVSILNANPTKALTKFSLILPQIKNQWVSPTPI